MWQLVSLDLILVCISYLKPKCCMFTSIFSLFLIHKPPLLFFWCPLHECKTFKWLYICGNNYMFYVLYIVSSWWLLSMLQVISLAADNWQDESTCILRSNWQWLNTGPWDSSDEWELVIEASSYLLEWPWEIISLPNTLIMLLKMVGIIVY